MSNRAPYVSHLLVLFRNLNSCQVIKEVENGDLSALYIVEAESAHADWKLERDLYERLYEALFQIFRVDTVNGDQSSDVSETLLLRETFAMLLFARVSRKCDEGTTFDRFSRRLAEEKESILHWALKVFTDDEWETRMRGPVMFVVAVLDAFHNAASEHSKLSASALLDRRCLQLSFYLATSSKVDRSELSVLATVINVFHHHVATVMKTIESGDAANGREAFQDLFDVYDNDAEQLIVLLVDFLGVVFRMERELGATPQVDIVLSAARSIDILCGMLQLSDHPVKGYILEEETQAFGLASLILSRDPNIYKKQRYALIPVVFVKVLRTFVQYAFGSDSHAGWEEALFHWVEVGLLRGLIRAYPCLPEKQLEALQPAETLLSKLPVLHSHPSSLLSLKAEMKRISPEMHENVLGCPLGSSWDLYCMRLLEQYIFLCYFEAAGIWKGCWQVSFLEYT